MLLIYCIEQPSKLFKYTDTHTHTLSYSFCRMCLTRHTRVRRNGSEFDLFEKGMQEVLNSMYNTCRGTLGCLYYKKGEKWDCYFLMTCAYENTCYLCVLTVVYLDEGQSQQSSCTFLHIYYNVL